MATPSRARSRPPTPAGPGPLRPALPVHGPHPRPVPPRPFVLAAAPHPSVPRPSVPRPFVPRPRLWLAVLGAAFSVLLAGVMTGAAALCTDSVCQGLTTPTPTRAELDLDRRPPEVPVIPGRPPTATSRSSRSSR